MIRLKRKLNEPAPEQLLILGAAAAINEDANGNIIKKSKTSGQDGSEVAYYSRVPAHLKKSPQLDSVIDKYAALLKEYKLQTGQSLVESHQENDVDFVYEYYKPCSTATTAVSKQLSPLPLPATDKCRIVNYSDLLVNMENDCDDIQFWFEDLDGDLQDQPSDDHCSTDSNDEDFHGNDYPDTDVTSDFSHSDNRDSEDSELTGSDIDQRFEYGGDDFHQSDYYDYYSSDGDDCD